MITKEELFEKGKAHRKVGMQCAPYDCRGIDKILLAESKKHPRPARWYADMRGEFNRGWQVQHWAMVS